MYLALQAKILLMWSSSPDLDPQLILLVLSDAPAQAAYSFTFSSLAFVLTWRLYATARYRVFRSRFNRTLFSPSCILTGLRSILASL